MMDEAEAVLVRIAGRVQGVGFRFWTRGPGAEAWPVGLGPQRSGWLRRGIDMRTWAFGQSHAGALPDWTFRCVGDRCGCAISTA